MAHFGPLASCIGGKLGILSDIIMPVGRKLLIVGGLAERNCLSVSWSPANILNHVKSPRGRLGKTAGCFNILVKQKEKTIQGRRLEPQSRISSEDTDTVDLLIVFFSDKQLK